MAKELTKKQEIFVAEYLVSLNATSAAIAAGYSAKSAESQGCQLLQNPKVAEQIAKKAEKRIGKLEISSERILGELARLAFFDPRKLFNADGSPKQVNELDDDTAAAVAGLDFAELFEGAGDQKHAYGLMKRYKVTDKTRALELLGKYRKLFTDKVELTGEDGGPIQTQSVPVDLSSLTDEELEQLAKIVAKSGVNKARKN